MTRLLNHIRLIAALRLDWDHVVSGRRLLQLQQSCVDKQPEQYCVSIRSTSTRATMTTFSTMRVSPFRHCPDETAKPTQARTTVELSLLQAQVVKLWKTPHTNHHKSLPTRASLTRSKTEVIKMTTVMMWKPHHRKLSRPCTHLGGCL